MYKHILMATDLVTDHDCLVEKTKSLAEVFGAKVSLLHTVEPVCNYGMYDFFPLDDWQEEAQRRSKEQLGKIGEQLNVPEDRQYVPIGSARKYILEIAVQEKVDLIVLGSHGRHGVGLVLLGSVASSVVHHADIDVLAVRVPEEEE